MALTFVSGMLFVLPVIFKSRFWVWLSCLPAVLSLWVLIRVLSLRTLAAGPLTLVLSFIVSLVSDVVLVAVTRQSLKWVTSGASAARVAWSIVIQIFLVLLVFLLPTRILFHQALHKPTTSVAMGALAVAVFNLPKAFASACFLASLAFLILYRATWPVVGRLAYIFTQPEDLWKRALLRTISIAAAAYGLKGIPSTGFLVKIANSLAR